MQRLPARPFFATGTRATAASAGDASLNALLDRISAEFLRESPEFATSLAVTEAKAGGRYIDRLSDASKPGKARQLDLARKTVTDIQAIKRDTLSRAAQVSYDVVLTGLQYTVETSTFDPGNGATAPYVRERARTAMGARFDIKGSRHRFDQQRNTALRNGKPRQRLGGEQAARLTRPQ